MQHQGVGHLLFRREGSLMAQPFDDRTQELSGEAAPVAEGLSSYLANGFFSASTNGVLVYRTGVGQSSQLTWFDPAGPHSWRCGRPRLLLERILWLFLPTTGKRSFHGSTIRHFRRICGCWIFQEGPRLDSPLGQGVCSIRFGRPTLRELRTRLHASANSFTRSWRTWLRIRRFFSVSPGRSLYRYPQAGPATTGF